MRLLFAALSSMLVVAPFPATARFWRIFSHCLSVLGLFVAEAEDSAVDRVLTAHGLVGLPGNILRLAAIVERLGGLNRPANSMATSAAGVIEILLHEVDEAVCLGLDTSCSAGRFVYQTRRFEKAVGAVANRLASGHPEPELRQDVARAGGVLEDVAMTLGSTMFVFPPWLSTAIQHNGLARFQQDISNHGLPDRQVKLFKRSGLSAEDVGFIEDFVATVVLDESASPSAALRAALHEEAAFLQQFIASP